MAVTDSKCIKGKSMGHCLRTCLAAFVFAAINLTVFLPARVEAQDQPVVNQRPTIGLPLGWLLRRQIVDHFELLSWALPAAVITYGIVLFVGERILGMPRELQLAVITTVTVVLFGIQFWSLSDPSIVRNEDA